jgi:hypothetical protein
MSHRTPSHNSLRMSARIFRSALIWAGAVHAGPCFAAAVTLSVFLFIMVVVFLGKGRFNKYQRLCWLELWTSG